MTYTEAVTSRDAAFWKEAINDEMDSIMSNETWTLVDLPPGSKPIVRVISADEAGRVSIDMVENGKQRFKKMEGQEKH
ncbi:hypothetical protein RJ639_022791 [Escallonia herrerae]|uniref:Uncharacterized protein n=1 Tax=Escallonia herrerae TaxID=1293975 RepID=A0AA89AEA1_9ASTE|nr:hypothetical protein RJ639_022791 [Escallonia herrerae]